MGPVAYRLLCLLAAAALVPVGYLLLLALLLWLAGGRVPWRYPACVLGGAALGLAAGVLWR
jgi:hypothetical protein